MKSTTTHRWLCGLRVTNKGIRAYNIAHICGRLYRVKAVSVFGDSEELLQWVAYSYRDHNGLSYRRVFIHVNDLERRWVYRGRPAMSQWLQKKGHVMFTCVRVCVYFLDNSHEFTSAVICLFICLYSWLYKLLYTTSVPRKSYVQTELLKPSWKVLYFTVRLSILQLQWSLAAY